MIARQAQPCAAWNDNADRGAVRSLLQIVLQHLSDCCSLFIVSFKDHLLQSFFNLLPVYLDRGFHT